MAQLKVLIIGFVWPEPTTTAAGQRMVQLIHYFLEQKYTVSFACTAKKTNYSYPLKNLGVSEREIKLNDSSFDAYVLNSTPNMVVFDRFLTEEQFGWRIAENAPNALRILDTEDLHSLRNTREQAFKKNLPFRLQDWISNTLTKREIASIYRCDISLIISTFEMQILQEYIGIDPKLLYHLPFLVSKTTEVSLPFSDRTGFVCIGNGNHAPNKDAVMWLKKEIWPQIRKELPNATLSIYGGHLPEHIKQYHNPKEGFLVLGWADNAIDAVGKAKICLAPLRFGAGLKGKLITAIEAETPSVTTPIGAEGILDPEMEWNGSIAEDTKGIVQAAVALYRSEELWLKAQENGKKLRDSLSNNEAMETKFTMHLKEILAHLKSHRLQNFIGSMLQHSTMASTKYMSKWIEAKNKI